jgi:hypothetical protein
MYLSVLGDRSIAIVADEVAKCSLSYLMFMSLPKGRDEIGIMVSILLI